MKINILLNFLHTLSKARIYNHCVRIPKLLLKKFYFFSLLYIRMSGKSINFDNNKIKKNDFYKNKKIFNIDDTDVNKILVSKKEPDGKKDGLKYFFGYNDNDVIRPSCLMLSQMTGYINKFRGDKENKFKENTTCLLGLKTNNF